MKDPQFTRPHLEHRRFWVSLALFILAIGLIFLTAPLVVKADGGGWPTPSPTFILFPTVTSLPTTEPYPYPKTLPTQFQLQAPLPSPTFFMPTAVPVSSSSSPFVCWPFALTFLLVLVLGSTVIFRRVRT